MNPENYEEIVNHIRSLINSNEYLLTQHANVEMYEDEYTLQDVISGIRTAKIIEYYPEHKRGSCCLLNGRTATGRTIHIVTTTMQKPLIVITVYEPREPKWSSPTRRGQK